MSGKHGGGRRRRRTSMQPGMVGHIRSVDRGAPIGIHVDERGSFLFARCGGCAWVGPGRRARSMADVDGANHLAVCPLLTVGATEPAAHGPGVTLGSVASPRRAEGVPAGKGVPDVKGVPDRERLTAHGRS